MNRAMLSRSAALALAAVVLIILAAGLVVPTIDGFLETRAGILAAQARLEQLIRRRLDAKAVEAYRQELDALPADQSGLLSVAANEDASVLLEIYLREALETHGGDITSVRTVSSTMEGGLRVLRATLTGHIPDHEAFNMVRTLEFGTPSVFFETFRLQRFGDFGSGEEKRQLELSATMRVYLDPPQERKDTP